ncbi:S8 family serine peptidase [Allohahella marinimesophila]|uniref:Peptidase S8/S53 domain-containing protein n=1 Tax=Allohahella marinimesophila TaxID=1054972 RepID=A0ABP7NNJ8_9GAMM
MFQTLLNISSSVTRSPQLRWVLVLAAAVQLSACGGGGGGSSGGPAPAEGPDGLPIPGQGAGAPLQSGQYQIGGTIEGLEGEIRLTERSGAELTRNQNGAFVFNTPVETGAEYEVEVFVPPVGQSCTVEGGLGTVVNENISSVKVSCVKNDIRNTLSGEVTSAIAIVTDMDVNDPAAPFEENNSFDSAQPVASFATIQGFLTKSATAGNGRFSSGKTPETDPADYFAMTLSAGQRLELQIVDFDPAPGQERKVDIDMYLFDAKADLLTNSVGFGANEAVTIPATGDYVVLLEGVAGSSKYLLNVRAGTNASAGDMASDRVRPADFVPGELIVKRERSDSAAAPAHIAADVGSSMPELMTFDISGGTSAGLAFDGPASASVPEEFTLTDSEIEANQQLAARNPDAFTRLQTLRKMKRIAREPGVVYAEPNYLVAPTAIPNDRLWDRQWNFANIRLPQAWDITTGLAPAAPVTVAVIDTGIIAQHEDLSGQLVDGYDFISSPEQAGDGDGIDPNPNEELNASTGFTSIFHGTHVAGTIGAKSNNGLGVAGVSWGARMMPLRTLTERGETYDIIQAIRYASGLANTSGIVPSRRADVVNMSFGGPSYAQAVADTIAEASAAGVIFVAAAGNENNDADFYPAAYPRVIAVSAIDAANRRSPYSSYGGYVDVTAPGGDLARDDTGDARPDGVYSTSSEGPGQTQSVYLPLHGTSMAAPHVSGVIALMKGLYPALDHDGVMNLIRSGQLTDRLTDTEFGSGATQGTTVSFGYGRINALKAVQAASRLAAGTDVIPLPPALTATPSFVSLGLRDSAKFTLRNEGGGSLILSDLYADKSWLRVNSVNGGLFGDYNVVVDRSQLGDGVHGSTINITLYDEVLGTFHELQVPVSVRVGSESVAGVLTSVTVSLAESRTQQVVRTKRIGGNSGSSARYEFTDVPNGTYTLSVSSDIDFNGESCSVGEVCGAYPVLGDAQVVVVANESKGNLDLVTKLRTGVTASE